MTLTENAIVLFHNSKDPGRIIGGENLIGRTLIALSKAGLRNVVILCEPGSKDRVTRLIANVRPSRISVGWQIREIESDLRSTVAAVAGAWDTRFLFLHTDAIWHPTLLEPMRSANTTSLAVYGGATWNGSSFDFAGDLREKFKIIFRSPVAFRRVGVSDGCIVADDARHVSCGALSLTSGDLPPTFTDVRDLADQLIRAGSLRPQWITNAWWLPVEEGASTETLRNYFWKVAFKEISGEFSKKVNSKLSRPLSLWLSQRQVPPNAISVTQVVLFVVSSSLLLIDSYAAMISFALLWQFAAGILDRCDGETARIRNYESEAGARFDMFVDDVRFYLPFFILAYVLTFLHGLPLYGWAWLAAVAWGLGMTVAQQIWMRRFGYVSLQMMNRDYIDSLDPAKAKSMDKWQPILKGDIRTFYVTVMSFFGSKEIIFWMLCSYVVVFGIVCLIGIRRLSARGKLEKITMPS